MAWTERAWKALDEWLSNFGGAVGFSNEEKGRWQRIAYYLDYRAHSGTYPKAVTR